MADNEYVVFVPLRKMPLNPNGKIDKPALPFPDTVQAASADTAGGPPTKRNLTPTESALHDLWQKLLPAPPPTIPVEDNFFDLGGHSILATRLIFEIRRTFIVDAPLGLIFDFPTIKGLSAQIDSLRDVDFGLAKETRADAAANGQRAPINPTPLLDDYAKDLDVLIPQLAQSYDSLPLNFTSRALTVFLTGATGFLGAFVLRDLLQRQTKVAKVICLVRAKDPEAGLQRLRESSQDRSVWDEDWVSSKRLEVVTGDLALDKFGLSEATWTAIAAEADAVLHNGAMVSY